MHIDEHMSFAVLKGIEDARTKGFKGDQLHVRSAFLISLSCPALYLLWACRNQIVGQVKLLHQTFCGPSAGFGSPIGREALEVFDSRRDQVEGCSLALCAAFSILQNRRAAPLVLATGM